MAGGEEAVALKDQGNKAFKEHDWPTAVDFYSKAIDLNDKEPTFFTNRALVCPPTNPLHSLHHSKV